MLEMLIFLEKENNPTSGLWRSSDMSFCSFIREQNPSGAPQTDYFQSNYQWFSCKYTEMPAPACFIRRQRTLGLNGVFILPAEVLIFHLLVEDKIFLKHPHPRPTGRDRWLQMLDPRYYQTHVRAFSQSSHQVSPPSAERLQETLTAHISGEILTAALLFLFQCSG